MGDQSVYAVLRQCAAANQCGLILCSSPSGSSSSLPLRDTVVRFSSYDLLCRVDVRYTFVNDSCAPAFVTYVGRYPDGFAFLNASVTLRSSAGFRKEPITTSSVLGDGPSVGTSATIPRGFFAVPIPTRLESGDAVDVSVSFSVASDRVVDQSLSDPAITATATVRLPLSLIIHPSLAAAAPSARFGRSRHAVRVQRRAALLVECRGSISVPTVTATAIPPPGAGAPSALPMLEVDDDLTTTQRGVIFVVDRSTSMAAVDPTTDDGRAGRSRWAAARAALAAGAEAAAECRSIGDMNVIFFSDAADAPASLSDAADATAAFDAQRVGGGTNLAAALDAAYDVHLARVEGSAAAPMGDASGEEGTRSTIVVVTDGAPDDVTAVVAAVERGIAATMGAVTVLLLQVGVDTAADAFLSTLRARLSAPAAATLRVYGAGVVGGRALPDTVAAMFNSGTSYVRRGWRRVFADDESYAPPAPDVDIAITVPLPPTPSNGVAITPVVCWGAPEAALAAGVVHLRVGSVSIASGDDDGVTFGSRVRVLAIRSDAVRCVVGGRLWRSTPPPPQEHGVVVASGGGHHAVAYGADPATIWAAGPEAFAALCDVDVLADPGTAVATAPAAPAAAGDANEGPTAAAATAGRAAPAADPRIVAAVAAARPLAAAAHGDADAVRVSTYFVQPLAKLQKRNAAASGGVVNGSSPLRDGNGELLPSPADVLRVAARAEVYLVPHGCVVQAPYETNAEVAVVLRSLATAAAVGGADGVSDMFVRRNIGTAPASPAGRTAARGGAATALDRIMSAPSAAASPSRGRGPASGEAGPAVAPAPAVIAAEYQAGCVAVSVGLRALGGDVAVTVITPTGTVLCAAATPLAAATAFDAWVQRHPTPTSPMADATFVTTMGRLIHTPLARTYGYRSAVVIGGDDSSASRGGALLAALAANGVPRSGADRDAFVATAARDVVSSPSADRVVDAVVRAARGARLSVTHVPTAEAEAVVDGLLSASEPCLVDPQLIVQPVYGTAEDAAAAPTAGAFARPLPPLLRAGATIASAPLIVSAHPTARGFSVGVYAHLDPYAPPRYYPATTLAAAVPVAAGGAISDTAVQDDAAGVVGPAAALATIAASREPAVRRRAPAPPPIGPPTGAAVVARAPTTFATAAALARGMGVATAESVPCMGRGGPQVAASLVSATPPGAAPATLADAASPALAAAAAPHMRPLVVAITPPPTPTVHVAMDPNGFDALEGGGAGGAIDDGAADGAGDDAGGADGAPHGPPSAEVLAICSAVVDELVDSIVACGADGALRLVVSQRADGSWPALGPVAVLAGLPVETLEARRAELAVLPADVVEAVRAAALAAAAESGDVSELVDGGAVDALLGRVPLGVAPALDAVAHAVADDHLRALGRLVAAAEERAQAAVADALTAADNAAAAASPPPPGGASVRSTNTNTTNPPALVPTGATEAADAALAAARQRVADYAASLPWTAASAARAAEAAAAELHARHVALVSLSPEDRRRQDAEVAAARLNADARRLASVARAVERARLDALQLAKERKKKRDDLKRRIRRFGPEQAAAAQAEFDAAEAAEDAALRAAADAQDAALRVESAHLRVDAAREAERFVDVCWATAITVAYLETVASQPGPAARPADAAAQRGRSFLWESRVDDIEQLVAHARRTVGSW